MLRFVPFPFLRERVRDWVNEKTLINYKTNENWFGDMRHLATSWTMVKIMRGVALMGIYTTAVCALVETFGMYDKIQLDTSIFSLLGVMLSIFLVFRTNTAYDRWWEGRKQWGALVNHSRNLAIYVNTMFPKKDAAIRHYMAVHISNFCIALSEHLRNGTKLDLLLQLSDNERAEYAIKNHIPNHISMQIFDKIATAHRNGEINEGDYINIKGQHQALLDILGACERIKKTPIPFSYSVYLKIFISIYAVLLPLALVTSFGFTTIPLVMFIFFALLGIELLGEEIEDPFGLDCNDLPTMNMAMTISGNVFEILEHQPQTKTETKALYTKMF